MKKYITLFLFLLPLCMRAQIIITVAGRGGAGFEGDGGPATAALLYSPYGVEVDRLGNLYICDNNNARIRKVSPAYGGIITTVAGNGIVGGFSGDGYEAIHAQINGCRDVAVDRRGNLFLADAANERIRKVSPAGIITTYAGTGTPGYNGDGIAATSAQLFRPEGVAVDDTGNVFIAENGSVRIRKVDTFGIITTVAGNGTAGFRPDGCRADTSALNYVLSVEVDKHGVLFFSDNARIRKIDADGKIVTVAGNGEFGYSGDNGPATAAKIQTIAFALDTLGNCYIIDYDSRVRKIGTNDTITTIAGYGYGGYGGDWGDPLLAKMSSPQGIAVAPNGDIFIGDVGNSRVRMITTHVAAIKENATTKNDFEVFPNPSTNLVYLKRASLEECTLTLTDIHGHELRTVKMNKNQTSTEIDVSNLPKGTYLLQMTENSGDTHTQNIVIN